MSEKMNDGGPAFPQSDLSQYDIGPSEHGNAGMSLRDYIAIKAMQGILAGPASRDGASQSEWLDIPPIAYKLADAMLRAREDRP